MMGWEKHNTESTIAGDRRRDRRYELQLDVKWKLIRRRRVLDTGTGQTIDVSSGGILFDAGRHLPEGLNVELSITWPVLLHNVAPMQLLASGRIVRATGRRIAMQTLQHEFRTAGVTVEQRNLQSPGGSRTPGNLSNSSSFAFSK
jgi:PilZ domain